MASSGESKCVDGANQLHVCWMIIFSKDRAFQLRELLRTLSSEFRCCVIFKASTPEFQRGYDQLQEDYEYVPRVILRDESASSFVDLLREAVARVDTPYMCFGVDDMLFYNDFSPSLATKLLDSDSTIFAYYTRLSSNITYCHTHDKPCQVPPLIDKPEFASRVFIPFLGTLEWSYPFDLCGSIYRTRHIREIMQSIEDRHGMPGLRHPNHFEVNGNEALGRSRSIAVQKCACPRAPVMSVVTVNRVQSMYENRIYDDDERTPEELQELFWKLPEVTFDLEHYRRTSFNSVHIGDFVLSEPVQENPVNGHREDSKE